MQDNERLLKEKAAAERKLLSLGQQLSQQALQRGSSSTTPSNGDSGARFEQWDRQVGHAPKPLAHALGLGVSAYASSMHIIGLWAAILYSFEAGAFVHIGAGAGLWLGAVLDHLEDKL